MYGDSRSKHLKVLDITRNRETIPMVLWTEINWNVFEIRLRMCGEIWKYGVQIHGEKIKKLASFYHISTILPQKFLVAEVPYQTEPRRTFFQKFKKKWRRTDYGMVSLFDHLYTTLFHENTVPPHSCTQNASVNKTIMHISGSVNTQN